MYISCIKNEEQWKGYRLVMPAVAVGNVGQLTCDLLVATLGMEKVGYLYDDSILPLVGNDPFATGEGAKPGTSLCQIVTSVEVFISRHHELVVVQQRAPFVKGRIHQFRRKFLEWAVTSEFSEVIILSSTFAHERRDKELAGPQLRYLLTPALSAMAAPTLQHLGWQRLEERDIPASLRPSTPADASVPRELFIPGGGIAKGVFRESSERNLPCAVLIMFCAEGDNIPEAVAMANYFNQWKEVLPAKQTRHDLVSAVGPPRCEWKFPSSWEHMYGSTLDQRLFH